MENNFVKNQHYIPQCVLANFANGNSQVFEALVDDKKIYMTNFKNSMVERFTYEHPILEKNKLEKFFGRIEDYVGPAIRKIISTIENHGNGTSTFKDIHNLVNHYLKEFIIFYYRSGALLHEFGFERTQREDRVYLLLDNILDSYYIRELSQTIQKYYEFAVIKDDKNNFLISDQFISTSALGIKSRFFNMSNRHMGLKDVIILIPISSTYYIVYYHGNKPDYIVPNKVNDLNDEQVTEINSIIINNSYFKCVGQSRNSIETAIPNFEWKSPSITFAGGSGTVMGATLKKELFFYEEDKIVWEFFTSMRWREYRNLGRNDKCICGSDIKFKKCCMNYYLACERIMNGISNKQTLRQMVMVNPEAVMEKGIGEFAAPERKSQ